MNKKILFNDGWQFAKSSLDVDCWRDLIFRAVDLPHDWLIYDTLNLYENSIGWYRKIFSSVDAQQVLIAFDGVYMDSCLYVNGKPMGEWKYGYSAFEFDITSALQPGENEIVVKVVHQAPNSRWYSGAGIYRNVWLKLRSRNYIDTNGIYVSSTRQGTGWHVLIDTDLILEETAVLTHNIVDQDEKVIGESTAEVQPGKTTDKQIIYVENPLLWSVDQPHLYRLITQLVVKDEAGKQHTIESVAQNYGFREIILDPDQGLVLNGNKMKLNGVCEHHDLGALGAAFNLAALRRRFKLLKDMGVNAIRTAHNMPASELMDLADEMGFLVVSEAFDMWERPKNKFDYARFFKKWVAKDVQSWVKRDRNHPSLLLWSIGNEIYDTHADERGQKITRMLVDYVHRYDPGENAKITIGSNYMPWENAQKCADIVKIAGYNYAERLYHEHHQQYPHWVIYGSETSSIVQSRGVYHFPFEKPILVEDDRQCSALGNSAVSWGAKSTEYCLLAERDAPFSLGQFIWTGFDYIGEPTPYHTKNSYFGQLDTATFKKDSYYVYQAAWTDYKKAPMVHIFPYWDFNPGQMVDVRVCSNAPRVELKLNGKTIGTHHIDYTKGTQLVGWWKVPYIKGELQALAYDLKGKVIATDTRRSFKDAVQVDLSVDKNSLYANGTDLAFVAITALDEDGNLVENASNRVRVNVSGSGRLLGLDNGDSTDYDQYKSISRRLFNGKLMAIIGSSLKPGKIYVQVTGKNLQSKSLELQSLPVDPESVIGVSANTENTTQPCVVGSVEEIPLRKIELICDSDRVLTQAGKHVVKDVLVEAKLYPPNTSYQDLSWSVVNDLGIETYVATVKSLGHKARVTATGDGEFWLRCTSKNGTDKVRLISQLEFRATGIGTIYKDPYQFIYGGLYDYSSGEVGNGNEKGVATARDGETQVGFRNLDFGSEGSDTITIPIFTLTNDQYQLQIWEGMPGEQGSELLADVVYQKPSKWNVYQPQTYKLAKRLRGRTDICFVTRQKMHIKGFSFTKQSRAYTKNYAKECEQIYGDTYTMVGDNIEGIGNNVTLEFGQMDFGKSGTTELIVYGRSPIDKNTIHLRFEGAGGESTQIIEFTKSEGYEQRLFTLNKITDVQKVSFILLPGCNFDFGWFCFHQQDDQQSSH